MLVDINLLPEREKERSTLLIAALAIIRCSCSCYGWSCSCFQTILQKRRTLESQLTILQASQEEIRSELQQTRIG